MTYAMYLVTARIWGLAIRLVATGPIRWLAGHGVDRSRDLIGTLTAAFNEAGPSLIALPIDYRENGELTRLPTPSL